MPSTDCYVCGRSITDEETHIIEFTDSSFNLCESCYKAVKGLFKSIDKIIQSEPDNTDKS